jgi:hypothetical protein
MSFAEHVRTVAPTVAGILEEMKRLPGNGTA